MHTPLRILIIEDEMLIAANIAMQLETIGYEIIDIISNGEDALKVAMSDKPDLVLMDINLKGELDGIETAIRMQLFSPIPIIYLTAYSDEANFTRAKATNPCAFISKPFKKLDLQYAIELASQRILHENSEIQVENVRLVLGDRIFVKQNDLMCKILIADILYLEADRNYCQVFTKEKNYLLINTLKNMENKLPANTFQRIHRSFIINLNHVNEFKYQEYII